jgi:hypothetical protein
MKAARKDLATVDRRPFGLLRRESVEICLDEHREWISPVRNHLHNRIRNERRYAEHSATYGLMVRSIAGMSVMISITTMRDAAGGAVIRLVIRMDQTVDSGWIWNEGNGYWRGNKRSQGKSREESADTRSDSFAQPGQHCFAGLLCTL